MGIAQLTMSFARKRVEKKLLLLHIWAEEASPPWIQ
jgi:hypothetical protein